MTDEKQTKKCAECQNDFEFKTHNQKYCSNQCCRVATNKRIMQKYYEKRDRLSGKERACDSCGAPLSKYNSLSICVMCEHKEVRNKTKKTIGDIENVIKGLEAKNKSKKSIGN
mgnify:CR=1 FL=1